jgi:hypothetical protein
VQEYAIIKVFPGLIHGLSALYFSKLHHTGQNKRNYIYIKNE